MLNRLQTYYLIGKILSPGNKDENRNTVISSLESGGLNWPLFISTGSNHLVLQTIYCKLNEQNLTGYIPSDVLKHLKYIRDSNYNRNIEILRQVKEINTLLGHHGITPLYIKGTGNIIDGLYSDVAERIMYDIDFLVQDGQWETAAEILIKDGYSANKIYEPEKRKEMKHYPRLSKPGTKAAVEIHRLPVDYIYSGTFGAEEVWQNKKWTGGNYNCYVMCDKHKIILNFIHSQLHHNGNLYAKTFMRNIYDLFLLSKRENIEGVFAKMNNYHRQAANYMRIMNKGFGYGNSYLDISGHTGIPYLFRYEINLHSLIVSRITFLTHKIFKAYIILPFLAFKDKKLRLSLFKKILDKNWYKQHLKSYKQKRFVYNPLEP